MSSVAIKNIAFSSVLYHRATKDLIDYYFISLIKVTVWIIQSI